MQLLVSHVFAGSVRPMPGDGRPTGIFKDPVAGPVDIGPEGLLSDAQADRRVHGGPEKAVHHFPLENHRRLAARFPEQAAGFVAGGLGENLSTEGADESGVCIGDVWAFGTARLQLSQPRSPCWKIDARHGLEGIALWIAGQGIAGWYYRVLEPGRARAGDALRLLQRNADAISLREFWDTQAEHRPAPEALRRLAATPGLNPNWVGKLQRRADYLRTLP
ncbi:MOSC domain-containing protein [Solimonas sp. K1W22B-7]|uniref:MOSC domain-containing protein n=1 Tax=Solimonas sp. K1W22B-7 TaxID=2303331 RepID=UPI000E330A80|nr:MOSC domain-containing protein [Solimonas sp. K1W22B-7]AXQ30844.1 MOSC domain-containing protein [Solimonas sp. K1W22B-7]